MPDVGHSFDADSYARTFKDAHVDSVAVFATCHHGQAYWLTDRPERHPSLPAGLDLLGQQTAALHGVGIEAPIYLPVQCNEFCANNHPEWIAVDPEGRLVRRPVLDYFEPSWQIMDVSSPYQDFLAEQLAEVLDRFAPADGVFLDMCWYQPSVSKWAIAGMKARGLDPAAPGDRARYAHGVAHSYMDRSSRMVARATDNTSGFGVWFNSRPKTNLHEESRFIGHIEVEALPTGGWGYDYFPYVARFVRPLGLPELSHTGRFFKNWGDNSCLKPHAALKYECSQILFQGFANGVGDLLHPHGTPSPEVYRLIGDVYQYIESCEPFVEGATRVSEAALIVNPALRDRPGPSGMGAVRALQQLRVQFDVRDPRADFAAYRLLIIPTTTRADQATVDKLRSYLAGGGAIIFSGRAGLTDYGEPVLREQGIDSARVSPYKTSFLGARDAVSSGLTDYPYVMYEAGHRIVPSPDASVLVDLGEPYFERTYEHFSGHSYTPFAKVSEFAAVIQTGRVVTFGVPILQAFGKHGSPNYKHLIYNTIDLLLPDRIVRDEGPSHMEIVVVRTSKTTVAHVFSVIPERRADGMDIIEDPVPLVGGPISIKSNSRPSAVRLQPHGTELVWKYEGGYVSIKLTLLDGHGVVVIEG